MARGHHYRPTEAHMGDHAMRADGGAARADGGSASHHEGKHHVATHGDGHTIHHHHYRKGGEVDSDAGVESYTAKPNKEEEEAEGAMRKSGGKAKRARGGSVSHHDGKHHVVHHGDGHEIEQHHHAAGGRAKKHVEMEGHKTKHRRLDRPGRKRGGGVGADMTPLTTAARTREAGAHKADNDELAE